MIQTAKTAFIRSLPVMAGYLVLGFGFGLVLKENGYGVLWALAMSLFIYAGSMQYVAVSLLASGASLISAALTALMVNARHLFYGISMIEPYRRAGALKPYLIFALTDETYSLVCTESAQREPHFYLCSFLISLFHHLYWITGSVLGALAGSVIPFSTKGVEFSMTALFITVFVDQWRSTKNHLPAIIGLAVSILCLLVFGRENFLIPSMIVISIALSIGRKYMPFVQEEKEGDK